MNDNVPASSAHHAQCIRLLNDLHDLFHWAHGMGLKIDSDDPSDHYALDFDFWRQELAATLNINSVVTNPRKFSASDR